jgi:hypothetical protein
VRPDLEPIPPIDQPQIDPSLLEHVADDYPARRPVPLLVELPPPRPDGPAEDLIPEGRTEVARDHAASDAQDRPRPAALAVDLAEATTRLERLRKLPGRDAQEHGKRRQRSANHQRLHIRRRPRRARLVIAVGPARLADRRRSAVVRPAHELDARSHARHHHPRLHREVGTHQPARRRRARHQRAHRKRLASTQHRSRDRHGIRS